MINELAIPIINSRLKTVTRIDEITRVLRTILPIDYWGGGVGTERNFYKYRAFSARMDESKLLIVAEIWNVFVTIPPIHYHSPTETSPIHRSSSSLE